MTKKIAKKLGLLLVLTLSIFLSACSSSDKSNIVIAPVPEFNNQFNTKVLWDAQIGNGAGNFVSKLTPAVKYNKIFVASRSGIVKSFDLEGNLLWENDLTKLYDKGSFLSFFTNLFSEPKDLVRLSGGLNVSYDKVFVGSEKAQLFTLDANTGKLLWQQDVGGEILSTPATDEGKVVVSTSNGKLLALDVDNGDINWQINIKQPALTLRSLASPVIGGGSVILGRRDGRIGVYLLENGIQVFEKKIGSSNGLTNLSRIMDIDSTPLLVGQNLYAISYNGSLISLNAQKNKINWQADHSSHKDMIISGLDLLLVNNESHIISLKSETGLQNWSQNLLENRSLTAPVTDGKYTLVGDFEGYVYWIDNETGSFVNKQNFDDSISIAPIIADGIIIIYTKNGRLVVLEN